LTIEPLVKCIPGLLCSPSIFSPFPEHCAFETACSLFLLFSPPNPLSYLGFCAFVPRTWENLLSFFYAPSRLPFFLKESPAWASGNVPPFERVPMNLALSFSRSPLLVGLHPLFRHLNLTFKNFFSIQKLTPRLVITYFCSPPPPQTIFSSTWESLEWLGRQICVFCVSVSGHPVRSFFFSDSSPGQFTSQLDLPSLPETFLRLYTFIRPRYFPSRTDVFFLPTADPFFCHVPSHPQ